MSARCTALVQVSFTHWVYLAWFMLGYQLTGPFIISAFRMLLTDIPAFLLVVSIFLGAFASSLYILGSNVGPEHLLLDFEVCLSALLSEFNEQHFGRTREVFEGTH